MRTIAFVCVAALSLGGCIPVVVGGVAAGAGAGYAAGQERGVQGLVSDRSLKSQVEDRWERADKEMASGLTANVDAGKVVITGTVKEPDWKVDAVRLAWEVEGVKEVHSEAEVRDKTTLTDDARDTWIGTRLRVALTTDPKIRSLNYSTETVNGVVYLMGSARTQEELDLVTNHARNIPNVRRVVSYVEIRPGEPRAPAAASAAPPRPAPVAQGGGAAASSPPSWGTPSAQPPGAASAAPQPLTPSAPGRSNIEVKPL